MNKKYLIFAVIVLVGILILILCQSGVGIFYK